MSDRIVVDPSDVMLEAPESGQGKPPPGAETVTRTGIEMEPPKSKQKSDDQDDQDQQGSPQSGGKPPEDKKKSDKKDKEKSGSGDSDQEDGEDQEDSDKEDSSGSGDSDKEKKDDGEESDGEGGSGDDTEEPEDGEKEKDSKGKSKKDKEEPSDDEEDGEGSGDSEEEPSDDQDGEDGDGEGDSKPQQGGDQSPSDSSSSSKQDDTNKNQVDNREHIEALKDMLGAEDGSAVANILNTNRHEDSHAVGTHDKEGKTRDPHDETDAGQESGIEQLNPEEAEVVIGDVLDNLVDSDDELNTAIENDVTNRAGVGSGGISNIHMKDKTNIVFKEMMTYVDRWIKKLKGDPVHKTLWKSDEPSRKVKGLWGRELEIPPKDETKDKILLFIFDTSGSMNTKLMALVCSDIATKMSQAKVINRIGLLNIEGVWSTNNPNKKFEPVVGIRNKIRRFLRLSTGSDLAGAWVPIVNLIKTKRQQIADITGIVIVSDFQVSSFKIPDELKKMKPSILALNVVNPGAGDYEVKEFIKANPGVNIYALTVDGRQVKQVNTMKVSK